MIFGLIVIIAIIGGAAFAHFVVADPGYVIINFAGYLIEMSVPVLLAVVALTIIALWMIVRFVGLWGKLGEAAGELRRQRQTRQYTRGLIAAAEGRFAKGERLLTRGADKAETPMLNYLAAARVAQQQGATERRDNWLMLAYEKAAGAGNAVLLTQAELQLANGQFEQAAATVARVREAVPNHPQAVTLLGRALAASEDWLALADLLPALRKHGNVDATTLTDWSCRAALSAISKAGGDEAALTRAWQGLDKSLASEPTLLIAYAERLADAGAPGVAEKALRKALNKHWQPELVTAYGELIGAEPATQLKVVEGWLKNRGDDAALLYAAGRICIRDELWGKARSYLESAIAIAATPAMYQAYGELLTALGEAEPAAVAFRRGLNLAAGPATLQLPAPPETADDAPDTAN